MEKLQSSQLAKMFLLLSFLFLLLLIPFISASLRSSYLYFILNLLIVVLGIEAGLLPVMGKPCIDEKKQVSALIPSPPTNEIKYDMFQKTVTTTPVESLQVRKKMFEVVEKVQKLKRCASRPSLFFIGSCDEEEEEEVVVVKEEKVAAKEEVGEISKQELFLKAEMFIGNFYKQLKMQREESWKKIHGLYDRAM